MKCECRLSEPCFKKEGCKFEEQNDKVGSRPVDRVVIRAFKTECTGVTTIVFAETAGQAKYDTMRAANDAGYRVKFTDVAACRAPKYDQRRTIDGEIPTLRMCHSPERLAQSE